MALRKKTTSRTMDEAAAKLAGLKAIETKLDLGNGVSVAAYEAVIAEVQAAREDYNSALAVADEKLNVFNAKENLLRAFSKKVLPAVGLKYGMDSSEYEKAGGTRESERKQRAPRVRKPEDAK